MPNNGAYTSLPGDQRIAASATISTGGTRYNWNAGYQVTLGDGDTLYMTCKVNFGATTWAPGVTVNEEFCVIGSSIPSSDDGTYPRLVISRDGTNKFVSAVLYDANGATHTATWTTVPSASTDYVFGASVKRYLVAGVWKVDVVLRDIGAATDLATLTGDTIVGANKTRVFSKDAGFGLPTTFAKGGTGQVTINNIIVNVSSGVTLSPTGSAWTQAAVDQIRTAMRMAVDNLSNFDAYAIGLLTVYDTSASGDGWPTTTTVIDWRLPTSDQTPLQWTPNAGSTHYTQVDDALGFYSTVDYVRVTAHSQNFEDQYGYPALSLSGKTVLSVGVQLAENGSPIAFSFALNVNGTLTAYVSGTGNGFPYAWWDKVTVGSGFPAAGFAHSQVMQF